MTDPGKTHFADDDTLVHIASLESQLLAAQVENKRLREALIKSKEWIEIENGESFEYVAERNQQFVNQTGKDGFNDDYIAAVTTTLNALALQPDLSLLEAHDAQVKREGAREALEKAADKFRPKHKYDDYRAYDVECELRRMIAALDQPTDQQKEG